jgi:hypothetical protein
MREIKFRGYDGMDWIYSSAVSYEKETDTWYMIEDGSPDYDWVMVCNVGQYTGLKDSEGREIYEGDIINNSPVIWDQEKAMFKLNDNKSIFNLINFVKTNEIQGNIYEDPELIKLPKKEVIMEINLNYDFLD